MRPPVSESWLLVALIIKLLDDDLRVEISNILTTLQMKPHVILSML